MRKYVFSDSLLVVLDAVERCFKTSDHLSVRALAPISLRIGAGEFVHIAGPSGSGKSTLLNILGCLDRPTAGRYWFSDRNVATLDESGRARLRRDEFGFVFQHDGLLDSMTAQYNVELPAVYSRVSRTERTRRAEELLEFVDLLARRQHYPAEMSGGERQRVAISRALMNHPRLILADEPTAALDYRQGAEILSLLQRLARTGVSVVAASHDPTVAKYATRRIELNEGFLISDSGAGSVTNTYDKPSSNDVPLQEGRSKGYGVDGFRAAIRHLRTHPTRAILIGTVVAIGVASAISLLAFADGVHRESLTVMGTLGADRIGVVSLPSAGGESRLDTADVQRIEQLPNVRRAFAKQFGNSWVQRGDTRLERAEVIASDDRPEFMWAPWPLESGDYINSRDSEGRSHVLVLGPKLRELLFPADIDPLGERIVVGGLPFEVKGVLAPHPIMETETHQSRPFPPTLQIPIAVGNLLLGPDVPMHIVAYVSDVSQLEETTGDLRDLLIRRHGNQHFHVSIDQQLVEPYRNSVKLRITVLAGIGMTSIVAASLLTMMLMWTAVRQRRKEIAIRLAVGARRRDIFDQFLAESAGATIAGTIFGVPLGLSLGAVLQFVTDMSPAYQPWFVWATVASSVGSGLVAGIVPAYGGCKLDPVPTLAA